MENKCCNKCNEVKPVSEFSKNKNTKDGLQIRCKSCMKEIANIYNHSTKGKLAHKKYSTTQKAKSCKKKYMTSDKGKLSVKKYFTSDKGKNAVKNYKTKRQGIYEWFENNISLYVGQSSWLNCRLNVHKFGIKNPDASPQPELYYALRQHKNASIRVIEECSPELLLEREQYYIDTYKPLYNKLS
jgi:hypothetical protein